MPESTLPPAGWYPDPHSPGSQRYWDGARWAQPETSTQPMPAAAPFSNGQTRTDSAAEGGAKWWKRTWVIALAAWILGLIMGTAGSSGGDSNDGSSDAASETVTVTAEPSDQKTVTETVTETVAPEESEAEPASQPEGSLPLEDGDWRLDSVQLKNDGIGDFGGIARITYIGEAQNADNLFTITVLNKSGGVVATLNGSAEGMDPNGTETVQLISTDPWKPGKYTSFDFQKQF